MSHSGGGCWKWGGGYTCIGQGVYGKISVPSLLFCCDHKTALKISFNEDWISKWIRRTLMCMPFDTATRLWGSCMKETTRAIFKDVYAEICSMLVLFIKGIIIISLNVQQYGIG